MARPVKWWLPMRGCPEKSISDSAEGDFHASSIYPGVAYEFRLYADKERKILHSRCA